MTISETTDPLRSRSALRDRAVTLTVLAAQMALVVAIYWPTLQLGFVSDAWVYLGRLRAGVWETLTTAIGYHYQPVACAWIALIWETLGESASAFQAVNMVQVGLLAHLAYHLGRRLLPDAGTVFMGSLLVVGSNAFYETSYWPLAGNMHLLAAQLYVCAVIVAIDVARGRFGAAGPWVLCAIVLAAIFTHPAMVTALPVCALTMLLAGDAPEEAPAAGRVRKIKALLPLALVVVLFGVSRLVFADAIVQGPQAALEPVRAYWLVSRGLVAVFSLRGSHDVVHGMMTFGTNAGFASTELWFYVAGWLFVALAAAAICVWRARTIGLRVLVAFLAIHIVIASIAGGMSSRQSHVPAVPAALLTAWAFHVAARRLAALMATPLAAVICAQLPAVGMMLLIVQAQPDHLTSAEVHIRAGNLSRALVQQIATLAPPGGGAVALTLVNMPAYTIERNIGAATFANGLDELARIASPKVASLEMVSIPIVSAPASFANGTVAIEPATLRSKLGERSRVVLLFENPSTILALTPEHLDRLTGR
jgi:hypothetical protein